MVILCAEDDEQVRSLVLMLLQADGFTVLQATDGQAALDKSRNHPGPIDLLLSDVMMPRLNGLELAKIISTERPETKVLMMSGYVEAEEELSTLGVPILEKPFSAVALRKSVQSLLISNPAPKDTANPVDGLAGDSRSREPDIEELRDRVDAARREYNRAVASFNKVREEQAKFPLPAPDGSAAVHNARLAESAKLKEYEKALELFMGVLVDRKTNRQHRDEFRKRTPHARRDIMR